MGWYAIIGTEEVGIKSTLPSSSAMHECLRGRHNTEAKFVVDRFCSYDTDPVNMLQILVLVATTVAS